MDETYTGASIYDTFPWFSQSNNDCYAKPIKTEQQDKPEFRHGFKIKLGTYIPFPFWHKFVAIPLLFRHTYRSKLLVHRMLIRGACSRKYDRPRKKLGKRIKLF